MKTFFKLLLIVLIAMVSVSNDTQAQITREGNTFIQTSKNSTANAVKTPYLYKDSKGEKYPIFITQNGRCFVNKISGKTGKKYKYYLDEETSKTIAKELGITYTPKQSKNKKYFNNV